MDSSRIYILDTSVLIDNPNILVDDLHGDTIVLPLSVIMELDALKSSQTLSTARQARHAIRNIRSILQDGNDGGKSVGINDSAHREHGGFLIIELNHNTISLVDEIYGKFVPENNDQKIIAVAYNYSKGDNNDDVILLTKDTNMSIIASSLGVYSQIYTSSRDEFSLSSGINTWTTTQHNVAEKLYQGQPVLITPYDKTKNFPVNTGVEVVNGSSTALGVSDGHSVIPIPWDKEFFGSSARGKEQSVAASLMLGDTAHDRDNNRNGEFFGSLCGRAGSGKTFLALGCALQSVLDGTHSNIKIFRPTVAPSKHSNLGFLPGSMEDKMQPWTLAITDILDTLGVDSRTVKDKEGFHRPLSDVISIESINHVRGRGFHNSFIIIDEAQNLEPHEIVTLLTRVGSGSCVVMTWDPSQIDNPLISSGRAEGPLEALRRTLGHDMVWHVELVRSERGGVSSLFR